MIERLLEADRARAAGDLDVAQVVLDQVVAADPRNSMAEVGLARVALDRGHGSAAAAHARRALEIDARNDAARRILDGLAAVADPPGPTSPVEAEPAPPRRGWLRRLLDRLLGRRDLRS